MKIVFPWSRRVGISLKPSLDLLCEACYALTFVGDAEDIPTVVWCSEGVTSAPSPVLFGPVTGYSRIRVVNAS